MEKLRPIITYELKNGKTKTIKPWFTFITPYTSMRLKRIFKKSRYEVKYQLSSHIKSIDVVGWWPFLDDLSVPQDTIFNLKLYNKSDQFYITGGKVTFENVTDSDQLEFLCKCEEGKIYMYNDRTIKIQDAKKAVYSGDYSCSSIISFADEIYMENVKMDTNDVVSIDVKCNNLIVENSEFLNTRYIVIAADNFTVFDSIIGAVRNFDITTKKISIITSTLYNSCGITLNDNKILPTNGIAAITESSLSDENLARIKLMSTLKGISNKVSSINKEDAKPFHREIDSKIKALDEELKLLSKKYDSMKDDLKLESMLKDEELSKRKIKTIFDRKTSSN